MQCPACGVDVVQEAVFCHKCGRQIDSPDEGFPDNQRNEVGAADSFREAVARRELQDDSERELWRGGYSSKAMIGGWVISGLIDVALLILGIVIGFGLNGWLILILLILLPWLYYAAVLCYRRMNVRYKLSTQRFVHESGILRRKTDRIEVLDMDDITFEQGPLERLMGVGTVRIVSSDHSHPDLSLPGIDNVKAVSEQFDDARLAERRRRGLHIEQI